MGTGTGLCIAADLRAGLYLAAFFVWPLLRVVLRSVLEPQIGLQNYAKVLFSGPYLQILLYTLEVAADRHGRVPADSRIRWPHSPRGCVACRCN